jgi:hypothetical protein
MESTGSCPGYRSPGAPAWRAPVSAPARSRAQPRRTWDLIGISGAYVSAVEEHQLMPTIDTLFALADAQHVAPADLLREAEEEAERLLLRDLQDRAPSEP